MKPSEKLYNKYEYLSRKYAGKVFAYESLSFEYEDLVQEFKIKIFTSIKSYGRRWLKYTRGEAPKPVPLKNYLECACGNKMRDFMKYISREGNKVRMDDINYDYGVEMDSMINTSSNKFVVRGIDLLEGLSGKERAVFSLYLRGYNMKFLNKVYCSNKKEEKCNNKVIESGDVPVRARDVVKMQIEFLLKNYGTDLRQSLRVYQTYSYED